MNFRNFSDYFRIHYLAYAGGLLNVGYFWATWLVCSLLLSPYEYEYYKLGIHDSVLMNAVPQISVIFCYCSL